MTDSERAKVLENLITKLKDLNERVDELTKKKLADKQSKEEEHT